ncbi:MAG: M28 family peptidase [Clostridium sp.]|nr:M28 family peptidase [Clostridium sp.]
MKKILIYMALAGSLGLTAACKNAGGQKTAESRPADAEAPVFSADSAFAYTAAQCEFGPRVPNTPAHEACGDYMVGKFRSFGASVVEQRVDLRAYNGTILRVRNIIASVHPERQQRILVCGHWDSRPYADNDPDSANWHKPVMAANDAASEVAVMLELARAIQGRGLQNIGVDFVCFDAEDYGRPSWEEDPVGDDGSDWCLGSQYWAANPHVGGYRARFGILMDMVGGEGCTFSQELVSLQFASDVVEKVWSTASRLGYGSYFPRQQGGFLMDDHVAVNRTAKIPCIDIVPYFTDGPSSFGPTWHTVDDTMEHIDPQVLKAVGQTVLQVIYNEDNNG